jgi:hypothetical protein
MGFRLRINEPLKRDSDTLNFTYGISLRMNEHLRQDRDPIDFHLWDFAENK